MKRTDRDIRREVNEALDACGREGGVGIDRDAVTRDLVRRGAAVDPDTFWGVVRDNDATQR